MKLIALKSDEIIKDKLQDSANKNIAILENFIRDYPDSTIEKNLILRKVLSMSISIIMETNDAIKNEINLIQSKIR